MSTSFKRVEKNVKLTEDAKDILYLAFKLAKKDETKGKADIPLKDHYCLKAMVMSCRLFNRTDALLKAVGAPPKTLLKDLKETEPPSSAQPQTSEAVPDEHQVLEKWLHRSGTHPASGKVQVDDLLQLLCRSEDPIVRDLLHKYQVSENRVEQAQKKLNENRVFRSVFFIAREVLEVVFFVLVSLIIIAQGFGEIRKIPTESMTPLLQVGDRVVIEKVTKWWRPYQRGDVLVFYPPATTLKNDPISLVLRWTNISGLIYKKEDNIDVAYIKRLIGLPGDEIEVRPYDGVYINGKRLNEPYVQEIATSCTIAHPQYPCQSVTVPEGHYFMMGDNRNHSLDSRYFGFQPIDRVLGRAAVRILPPHRLGVFDTPGYHKN